MFQGSDELKLEVARTSNLFALGAADLGEAEDQQQHHPTGPTSEAPILTGYLWKKSQSASRLDESGSVWYRRWFVLKRDNCLYYYKNQDVSTSVVTIFPPFPRYFRYVLDGRTDEFRPLDNNSIPRLLLLPAERVRSRVMQSIPGRSNTGSTRNGRLLEIREEVGRGRRSAARKSDAGKSARRALS